MENIIELDNGLKFIILSRIKFENNKYLFVASVTEEMKFLFLQQIDDNGGVAPVEDGELVIKLSKEVVKQFQNN